MASRGKSALPASEAAVACATPATEHLSVESQTVCSECGAVRTVFGDRKEGDPLSVLEWADEEDVPAVLKKIRLGVELLHDLVSAVEEACGEPVHDGSEVMSD